MSLGRTFTLNTGAKIPAVGFGTFSSQGSEGEAYRAVLAALRVGYRHLDCAWFYQNESEIGNAIHDFLQESNGAVKREDLFICTKVWNHLHAPEDVQWSLESSLKDLKLEYVDLFLVHWPLACERDENHQVKLTPEGKYIPNPSLTADPTPTWRAMESLYTQGKAKSIGVSNWTIPGLTQLLSIAKISPSVNQVECHPFLPNTPILEFCKSHNILLVAYSPLGSQNQVPSTGEKVSTNPTLNQVAKRSGHTLAQMLISWGVQRGYAVLPKSSDKNRIESNFADYVMSDGDFEEVCAVAKGRNTRFVNMKELFAVDLWPEESDEAEKSGAAAA